MEPKPAPPIHEKDNFVYDVEDDKAQVMAGTALSRELSEFRGIYLSGIACC